MKKNQTKSVDREILRLRAEGLTLAAIGKRLGMTRQGVHSRLAALEAHGKQRPDDVLVELLQQTNRLLAGVIVRICALQTTRREYPFEVLTGLGLTAREIADATGTTEAVVNVTKTRARRSRATSTEDQLVSTEETVQ